MEECWLRPRNLRDVHSDHVNERDMLAERNDPVNLPQLGKLSESEKMQKISTQLSNRRPISTLSQNKRKRIFTISPGAFSGIERMDFMKHFMTRGLAILVSKILQYVDPRDLCSMHQVSQLWKSLFLFDSRADIRRKTFVQNLKNDLENQNRTKSKRMTPRKVMNNITNTTFMWPTRLKHEKTLPEIVSPSKVKHNRFAIVASTLKQGEKLEHCPRCKFPALVEDCQAICTQKYCAFSYCTKCRCETHKGTVCPVRRRKTESQGIISSKSSKKRLKRLCLS